MDKRSLRTRTVSSYVYKNGAETEVLALSIILSRWKSVACEFKITLIRM